MKRIKQNMKRLRRKHTKKLKEKRKKEEEILSAFCSLSGANFSAILYDSQGDLVIISMDELNAFLDMEGCDV